MVSRFFAFCREHNVSMIEAFALFWGGGIPFMLHTAAVGLSRFDCVLKYLSFLRSFFFNSVNVHKYEMFTL